MRKHLFTRALISSTGYLFKLTCANRVVWHQQITLLRQFVIHAADEVMRVPVWLLEWWNPPHAGLNFTSAFRADCFWTGSPTMHFGADISQLVGQEVAVVAQHELVGRNNLVSVVTINVNMFVDILWLWPNWPQFFFFFLVQNLPWTLKTCHRGLWIFTITSWKHTFWHHVSIF